MFIEPTITWVPTGFSGYIWLDTKIALKKNISETGFVVLFRFLSTFSRCHFLGIIFLNKIIIIVILTSGSLMTLLD